MNILKFEQILNMDIFYFEKVKIFGKKSKPKEFSILDKFQT
jgi:hypothetical protein